MKIYLRKSDLFNRSHTHIKTFLILIVLCNAHICLASELLKVAIPEVPPLERRIDWNPGREEAIPEPQIIYSVIDFGAIPNDELNDSAAFQAAIDAVPIEGGAVIVPAGKYLLEQMVTIKDNVVLRGEGEASEIHCHIRLVEVNGELKTPPGCLLLGDVSDGGTKVSIVAGYEKGSQRLEVANSSTFAPGTYVEIEQKNNHALMYTNNGDWDQDWSKKAVGQIGFITKRKVNEVILKEPLHFTYSAGLFPSLRAKIMVENPGLEKLKIITLSKNSSFDTIRIENAVGAWIRDISSVYTSWAHVGVRHALHCEIRDSSFRTGHSHVGGHSNGVNLGRHTTSCLVENNTFEDLRHAMNVHLGANGNVIGYNFSTIARNEIGNPFPDFVLHGHYPLYNLAEGNIFEEAVLADYWGPSGPGNTLLRNCVTHRKLKVQDSSHNQNILGNSMTGGSDSNVFRVSDDVDGTLLHGHFEQGITEWDPSLAHWVPDSLYLSDRPDFYDSPEWPSTGVGTTCTNPAQLRWATLETHK